MMHPDIFRLALDDRKAHDAAQRLFEKMDRELRPVLPATAEIMHVGATAIPGCLTKGDLDIVIRVDRGDFKAAEASLAARFLRNPGSVRTEEFAAFEDGAAMPHLGIQLTAKDGALDVFHRFAAALLADPDLVQRYNALKCAHDGQPMESYRKAKDAFVAEVLFVASRAIQHGALP